MELSMRDLFPACVAVLGRKLRPLHYADLTRIAMSDALGINAPAMQKGFAKNAENVREKLLMAGQRGTFYTGKPLFCGALRSWFRSDAQLSFVLDHIRIPGSAQAGSDGAYEALMRAPHMVVHNPHLANTERLARGRSSGLVLEKHVARWFARQYPEFYGEASNAGRWKEPCGHDFTLTVNGRTFLIDIAGPDQYGAFGLRGRKHPTDLHFLCRIDGDDCLWEGVVRGTGFRPSIDPHDIFSPTALVVHLNCARHGIAPADVRPREAVA